MSATTATTMTAAETAPVATSRRKGIPILKSGKAVTGVVIFGIFVILAVVGPWIAPQDPGQTDALALLQKPSADHWMGTTQTGQDVFSQVLIGARASMLVGLVSALVATTLSIIIGVTAGYLGGFVDEVLSMTTNIFLVIPALPLTIVLTGYLKNTDMFQDNGWVAVALVLSVTGWAFGARILRAQTLSLRSRDYVKAAKAVGERPWRVVLVEIVPNLGPIIISGFLLTFVFAILAEASLSYLGLGDVNTWTWGTTLFWAQTNQAFSSNAWWWYIPPGACIALVGASMSLINFGADEILNPRLAGGKKKKKKKARPAKSSAQEVSA